MIGEPNRNQSFENQNWHTDGSKESKDFGHIEYPARGSTCNHRELGKQLKHQLICILSDSKEALRVLVIQTTP